MDPTVKFSGSGPTVMDWFAWTDVPAGQVAMGTPLDEIDEVLAGLPDLDVRRAWFVKETPRHVRQVAAFLITTHLVTNAQMREFTRRTGYAWQPIAADDHPAVAGHDDAVAFAAWLAERSGLEITLPSEEQWERAARGADLREYPWGDHFTPNHANMDRHSLGTTAPVGSYPKGASAFGLLDMAGNLDEWTATEYHPYPGGGPEVPVEETHALSRFVTRGGGWNHCRDAGRCARRHGVYQAPAFVGFRLSVTR
ncbi:formylglycine-generating enzyme family protein [Kitasatospora sp. HPMI-4]|uniref:formylglycine-generating enzyme family protein n=1 Tax=Kitasatospora sp. HPMI-4 TaxID=3448443 RepID=UPI003F19E14C